MDLPFLGLMVFLLLLVAGPDQVTVQNAVVPEPLRPPSGQVVLMHLRGKGKQIYVCEASAAGASAWKFKAPEANLYNIETGDLVGRHYAGPTWESDGSKVVGKVVATVLSPDANSIPWLLLTMVSRSDTGMFSKVQTIQRLQTKGGVAPATGCGAANFKEETAVPYEAIYSFYGAAH